MISIEEFKSYFKGVIPNKEKLISTFYNILLENNYDFTPSDEDNVVGYIKDKDGNTVIRLDNSKPEPEAALPYSTFEEAIDNIKYTPSILPDLNMSHGKWYTRFDNNRKRKRR